MKFGVAARYKKVEFREKCCSNSYTSRGGVNEPTPVIYDCLSGFHEILYNSSLRKKVNIS